MAILANAAWASACLPASASFDRGLELGAGFGRFPQFPPLVAAPARDPEDDQQRDGDDEIAVAFPKLLELFAPDFLIDLSKNIRHFNALQPAVKVDYAGSRPRPEGAVN